jgi:hypothetical protein
MFARFHAHFLPCESKPQLGENDPARRFVNLKACFYQALADAFERDQIEGLTDETTIRQLSGLLYELDSQGRMKIESKEQARARGVPSPDRAEALMLALGKPRKPGPLPQWYPPKWRLKIPPEITSPDDVAQSRRR